MLFSFKLNECYYFKLEKNETVVHIYYSNYNHYLNSHTDVLTSYNRVFDVPQNEYINSKNPEHFITNELMVTAVSGDGTALKFIPVNKINKHHKG